MDNIQSTRTRLHSFITYPLKNVTSRQRDAVQKMLFLEEDQFQELLMDIQDEIARRECRQKEPLPKSDAYTTKRNKSRQNLARLNSGKFENLVIDVLLVLNHRFPDLEEKNVTEIETLIGDLEKLITDLKGDMAYEQLVIEQVGSEKDLKLRLHIYNKYVRRMLEKHNEDVSVVQFVDEILKCQADCTSVSMFDLMDTNVFLKQCEVFFKKMNMYSEEYDYHRGNLITLVDEKIFSVDVHEKLVRKEKKSLFELMLKVDKKSKKGDRSIEREVNTIITSLSTIKDLYKSGEDDEYFAVAKNVADAIDNLIKKLDGVDNVDTDQVNELVGTREELIKLIKERNGECIPMTIFNMARLVKNILYCIPSFTYTVDPSLFTTLSGDLLSRELGFVSEVASNAFDAITKAETQGKIQMKIDGNRFSIRDNGIGMDDKDIVKFIGSVGGSSSRTDEKKNLIGRFGMGFYSLFKYADLVEIFTKKKDGKGFKSSLQRTNNTFVVEECDLDFQGTEIVGYLNEEMKLTEKDLEEWVSNNLIHTGDNHSVVLIKSDEELENERNRVIEEYNKRKEEKIKRAEEKAAKREEAKQKAAEKAAEKEAAREAAKEAGEEEPVEEVEETEEPVEEEEEETEEEDLESLLAKITPTKDLSFAPWTNHDDMQIFKDIHKNRYNATSNLKYGQKTNFNVLQKKNNGREVSTRFDAIILIPELNMMSEPADGNIEIFVSGTKITDPNFKLPSSLKFVSAIIKSNDALITSTREGFYDSENTCKNIVNAIQKKIRDLFIQKTDEEIHAYNKIIKRTYLDNIQSANVSVAEKFAALLTFETNAAVKSIHKLSVEIEEMNNETKEKGLKPIDSIYYTNTLISLVKETESPLFDGIEVPYIFLNDIHDEEIVKALKSYGGMPLVNISTAKFENKTVAKEQEEEFKGILETIKNVLSPFVSDVFVSKRLVKLPFSIMAQKNSMTSAYKNVVGENELEKHPFRQYIDPKPVLEVNLDSKEIIALKNNMNEGAIFNMFLAASIACRLDVYSKAKCVNMLMNNARESLDVEKTKYEEKKEENSFDWMNKMPNMDDMMKDNEGLNDEDLSEVSDKENEDFNMDSNDLADKENEEVNKDVNDLNEKYLNDLAEKDLNEVSGKENEDVNMDINEVSDKDLNEVYDKENEEVSDDLFDDKDMSDDDKENETNDESMKENETNDESMKDMFSGDKMKDMFSGDMMQKMKEMFKDDESMKDLFSDEKMKEMEDMFKGDGMKNMFNNDKMKEMFNNENMPGNDSVREDL